MPLRPLPPRAAPAACVFVVEENETDPSTVSLHSAWWCQSSRHFIGGSTSGALRDPKLVTSRSQHGRFYVDDVCAEEERRHRQGHRYGGDPRVVASKV